MLWEEYYEKIDEWANSTAVNRLSKLESFGPPEEIIYVINELAFENEKAATRLLRMATDVGVKFTGEQLAEICLICEESEIERAIRHSCSHFSAADIEALYGCYDNDLVVEVAKKARLPLPEDLQEWDFQPLRQKVHSTHSSKLTETTTQLQTSGSKKHTLHALRALHSVLPDGFACPMQHPWRDSKKLLTESRRFCKYSFFYYCRFSKQNSYIYRPQ